MTVVLDKSGNSMAGYGLVVYDDDDMALDEAAKLMSIVLGYEMTQASSCALLVQQRGEYLVKRYKASQKVEAEACVSTFSNNGIPCELIRL